MNTQVATTKNSLTDTLLGELNQLHDRACQLDETIKKDFAEKLQICRQIADLLESARSNLRKSHFEAFCRKLSFSQPVLKSYQIINKRAKKAQAICGGAISWITRKAEKRRPH